MSSGTRSRICASWRGGRRPTSIATRSARTTGRSAPAIPAPLAIALPHIVTRAGLYGLFGEALGAVPRIDPLAREVLAGAVARAVVAAGPAPPFAVGRRWSRRCSTSTTLSIATAAASTTSSGWSAPLESGASFDRGAARLLEETRFLAAAFRGYAAALAAAGLVDEHGLRARLLGLEAGAAPFDERVVAVPDFAAAPEGLWPADYDLLTRLAGLESLTVVATEGLLGTGYLTRLLDTLPDVEVVTFAGEQPPAPVLATPGRERDASSSSAGDREDEVDAFASRVRAVSRPGPTEGAIALVTSGRCRSLPGAPGARRARHLVAGGGCAPLAASRGRPRWTSC